MGTRLGETPTYGRDVALVVQRSYDSSNRVEYEGFAFPGRPGGVSTAAAVWSIRRFTYVASGNGQGQIETVRWAGGNDAFDQVWDNRATTLTYS